MKDRLVLGIETSGILCSVAWFQDDRVLLEYNMQVAHIHAALLAKLVKNGFEELAVSPSGPGSFTGLRIGMSYAKGLCFGLQKPIKGVSNFAVLAESAPLNFKRLITIIDARRNNYYMALFPDGTKQINDMKLIAKDELTPYLTEGTIIVANKPTHNSKGYMIHGRYGAGLICKIGLHLYVDKGADSLEELEPLYMESFAGMA
jgi:tRNA threonylcarbamoyl adenosine modification protein YeaZ